MIIYENVEYDSIESYDDLKRVFDMLNRIEIKRKYNDSKNKWYYFEDNFIVELIGNNILKNVGLIRLDTPLKNTDGGIVYDAHNVESNIRKNTKYYNYTFELEKELVERANLVLTVSNEDYKTFKEEFNCKTVFLATHILGNKIYSWEGINSKNIVFIGSIYKPNIDAVEYIMSIASELPDFQFSIIGNVNLHRFSHVPKNVKFYGMIGEDEKNRILSSSIMALNPVFEGGGRNVKMVDYIMHGLPIISTTIGVRGFSGYDLNGAIIVSDNIKEKLQEVVKNKELLKSLSENVYKLANEIIQQEGSINTESIIKKEYKKWKYLEQ